MKSPDTSYQSFMGAVPEVIEKITRRNGKGSPITEVNVAYVEEVAAHLEDMQVGEVRIIPHCPTTLKSQNMIRMLNYRGWRYEVNFTYGRLHKDPVTDKPYGPGNRPYFFKRTARKLQKYE